MTTIAFYSSARPTNIRRLHEGPLGPYIDNYAARLLEQGFSRSAGHCTVRLIADLSRWLERKGLGVDGLDEVMLQQYRRSRARSRPLGFGDPVALRRFLDTMRDLDICVLPSATRLSPCARIQQDFRRYLTQEIGLSARTLEHYTGLIDRFLQEQVGPDGPQWSTLTGAQVLRFFRRCARRRSAQYLQRMRTALRSFLRYLRYRGEIQADLCGCIPAVAQWRLTTLPRYLAAAEVQRLLRSCDRQTAEGRRDYAVLLILARLGLRAIEVATLSLDNIDWHTGLLTLRAKGGENASMPLPSDVGQAICEYLQDGRPPSNSRRIFTRHHAPHVGFSSSRSISALVKVAMERAGIDLPSKGAHVLRHTLATQMLKNGATLREIGQVLRHRSPDTTRIYAKVDLPSLRFVALPWPEDAR